MCFTTRLNMKMEASADQRRQLTKNKILNLKSSIEQELTCSGLVKKTRTGKIKTVLMDVGIRCVRGLTWRPLDKHIKRMR